MSNTVLVPDPVYPVYVDDNVMAGRTVKYMGRHGGKTISCPCRTRDTDADIVYLCSPNNPTGAAYTTAQLEQWVAWAKAHHAVILYDAAYECFVTEPGCARSIFEVEGAKEVAVEVCSFSKIAGFTGTRCGYTIVPAGIEQDGMSLNKMWLRRQTTKFNGVPYIVQRGAEAVFTDEGMKEIQANLDLLPAKTPPSSPPRWTRPASGTAAAKTAPTSGCAGPAGMKSWDFFDWLLENAHVVGTPGSGFGPCGEGYFRLTGLRRRRPHQGGGPGG